MIENGANETKSRWWGGEDQKFRPFRSDTAPSAFFYFRKIQVSKMARPRKPTNVLELTGAFKKDPSGAARMPNRWVS